MQEEWLEIEEAPLYEVSSHGRVRNRLNGREVTPHANGKGVLIVGLRHLGQRKTRAINMLVARTFLEEPEQEGSVYSPMHKDGDKTNLRASNLIWRPRWYVKKRTQELNIGPTDRRPIRDMLTGKVYSNAFEAAQEYHSLEYTILWCAFESDARTVHGRSWEFAYDLM